MFFQITYVITVVMVEWYYIDILKKKKCVNIFTKMWIPKTVSENVLRFLYIYTLSLHYIHTYNYLMIALFL